MSGDYRFALHLPENCPGKTHTAQRQNSQGGSDYFPSPKFTVKAARDSGQQKRSAFNAFGGFLLRVSLDSVRRSLCFAAPVSHSSLAWGKVPKRLSWRIRRHLRPRHRPAQEGLAEAYRPPDWHLACSPRQCWFRGKTDGVDTGRKDQRRDPARKGGCALLATGYGEFPPPLATGFEAYLPIRGL